MGLTQPQLHKILNKVYLVLDMIPHKFLLILMSLLDCIKISL